MLPTELLLQKNSYMDQRIALIIPGVSDLKRSTGFIPISSAGRPAEKQRLQYKLFSAE